LGSLKLGCAEAGFRYNDNIIEKETETVTSTIGNFDSITRLIECDIFLK
jgi:hypothetical protein